MTTNQWGDKILEKIAEAGVDLHALFSGPFSFRELLEAVRVLVDAAELVMDGPTGRDKHAAVLHVFNTMEERHQWKRKLDDAIKLPFFLEQIDNQGIDLAIGWLIESAVGWLQTTMGWGSVLRTAPLVVDGLVETPADAAAAVPAVDDESGLVGELRSLLDLARERYATLEALETTATALHARVVPVMETAGSCADESYRLVGLIRSRALEMGVPADKLEPAGDAEA
jgi:hypothetical protein